MVLKGLGDGAGRAFQLSWRCGSGRRWAAQARQSALSAAATPARGSECVCLALQAESERLPPPGRFRAPLLPNCAVHPGTLPGAAPLEDVLGPGLRARGGRGGGKVEGKGPAALGQRLRDLCKLPSHHLEQETLSARYKRIKLYLIITIFLTTIK